MTPFLFQEEGSDWLASRTNALLADEAGLGKTAQGVWGVKKACASRGAAKSVAVICPAIAVSHWKQQFEMLWPRGPRPIVESYDRITLRPSYRAEIKSARPDFLILDESQRLKNREAKRTRVILGPYCRGNGLASVAKRHWLLSATPAPNDGSEYWPMLRALWPDLIDEMSYYDFVMHFFNTASTRFGLKVVGNRRPEELREILRQISLRRRVEAVMPQLPKWNWEPLTVDPVEAIDGLRQMEASDPNIQRLQERVNNGGDFHEESVHFTTLRRLVGEAVAPAVGRMVFEELTDRVYPKIVLIAHHHRVINILHSQLGDLGCVQITGKSSPAQREEAIYRFQNDPTCRVFIGQDQACREAITLTAASQMINVEPDWVPDNNYQAAKRIHRIGQDKPVFIRMCGLAGSVFDSISRANIRKIHNNNELRLEGDLA